MSWNNDQNLEKNDSSIITNSFRSVHSSSGVSSTGSFLFSTDDDSSITTTTTTSSSIPSNVPSNVIEKDDKKDNQQLSESDNQTIIGKIIKYLYKKKYTQIIYFVFRTFTSSNTISKCKKT
jgi:hypothetical protein